MTDTNAVDPRSAPDDPAVGTAVRVIVGGVALWLLAAAIGTQIEYYDGLSAIANARYFLGTSPHYIADRGPLMAWLLMPAEWARSMLSLHTLDVRPHHALLAVLHAVYLAVTWRLLSRRFGRSWAVLLAWVAAVPSFVFFTYSPFVSHDLLPGAMLLAMLCLLDGFTQQNRASTWRLLVLLGAAAALMKQTFGVFWVLIVAAAIWRFARSGEGKDRITTLKLACGALCSGAIVWLLLGLIFADSDPQTPLLSRPWRNLQYLSSVYDGKDVAFPIWLYVRNLPACGWLASLLVIPGWALAMRGTRFEQSVGVAWMGGLIFVCVLPLREVRYMAFLAPLTAVLLVPVLRRAFEHRAAAAFVLLVFAADAWRSVREAGEIFDPFYTSGIERRFLALLDDPAYAESPVLLSSPMLSFVAPTPSPFAADRYHRVFHFGVVHLRYLYGRDDLRILTDRGALETIAACPDNSLLMHADQVLARGPDWQAGAPLAPQGFMQCLAVCRSTPVRLTASIDRIDADVVLLPGEEGDGVFLRGASCVGPPDGELLPVLLVPGVKAACWLNRTASDAYAVRGEENLLELELPRPATIRRFEVSTRMQIGAAAQ